MAVDQVLNSPSAWRAYKKSWNMTGVKPDQNIVNQTIRSFTNVLFSIIRLSGNSMFLASELFFIATLDPTLSFDQESCPLNDEEIDCIKELRVKDAVRIGEDVYRITSIDPIADPQTEGSSLQLLKEETSPLLKILSPDLKLQIKLNLITVDPFPLSFLKMIRPNDNIVLEQPNRDLQTIIIDSSSFTLSENVVNALMQNWPNPKSIINLHNKLYMVDHVEDFPFEEGHMDIKVDAFCEYDYLTICLKDGLRGQLVLDPYEAYEGTTHNSPLQFDSINSGDNVIFRNHKYGVKKVSIADWRNEYFIHHHTLEFYNDTGSLRKMYLNPV